MFDQIREYGEEQDMRNLRVIFNDGQPGASAARNLGIGQAKGDIIAFLDDDAVAYSDWAEKTMQTYSDESVVGVTGPAFPLWQSKPAAWFPEEFYWILSCTSWTSYGGPTEVRNIWLQNGSFRREAFELAGVLDAHLGPNDSIEGFKGREFKTGMVADDVELSLRVKKATQKRILFNPETRVKHRVDPRRLKLAYVARWSYWLGYSKHRLKRLHPDKGSDVLNQERGLLRRIATKLVPSMIVGAFSHPIQTGRKLLVTATALSCVSAGYLAAFYPLQRRPKATSR